MKLALKLFTFDYNHVMCPIVFYVCHSLLVISAHVFARINIITFTCKTFIIKAS